MRNDRVMTLRLPDGLADDLDLVATVDEVTRSDAVRTAITAYCAARRSDPDFQARAGELAARLARVSAN